VNLGPCNRRPTGLARADHLVYRSRPC
jgi:hypothetical protein